MKPQSGLLAGSAIFLLFSFFNYGLRFLISVIVARTLGIDGKGVYVLALTSSGFLTLFLNLGLPGALTYLSASKQFSQRDLFSFGLLVALPAGVLGAVLFWVLYQGGLNANLLAGVSARHILLVALLLPFSLLTNFITGILIGAQQLVAANLIEFTRNLSNLALQLLAWQAGLGLDGAIGAWFAAGLLALLVALWQARSDLSFTPAAARQVARPAFGYGSKSYLANLLSIFNYRLDSYLVNGFLGLGQVGLYSTGVGLAELLWYFPNAVSSALFPKVSGLDADAAGRITARICRQTLLLVVVGALALALLAEPLIGLVYGAAFRPAAAALRWLLPGIAGMAVTKVLTADLSGRGKPQYATRTSALSLVVTLAADLLLIPAYGILGAAAASSVAYLSSALLSLLWFGRETGLPWREALLPRPSDLSLLVERLRALAAQLSAKSST